MKNRKGFTLVELLAVIAILAILVIIALPNVLKMFRQAKENTFVTELQEIIKTAEDKYITTAFTSEECHCFSSKSTDKKHNLDLSGRKDIEYYVEFNDKGQIINLVAKDDSYQFVSEGEVIQVADIGNSTSGKKKMSSPATAEMKVPSCDESSEENSKLNIQYASMLRVFPHYSECEYAEGLPYYFCTNYEGKKGTPLVSGTIKSLKISNTNKVPEGVLGSADVTNDNSKNIMMWWTDIDNDGFYEVTIGGAGGVRANTDSSDLFSDLNNIETLDLTYLDTSQVTNMRSMFSYSKIKTLDLSNFDTSKVTNMSYMFYNCPNLTNINLSSFNTSKVTNMNMMFCSCSNLTTLDLSSFDTSNVTDMGFMFESNKNLTSIKYGKKFVVNDETEIGSMFFGTDKLINEPYIKYNSKYDGRL